MPDSRPVALRAPSKRRAVIAVSVLAAICVGYLIHRFWSAVFNAQVHPQPRFVPAAVDGMVAVNEAIRAAAPYGAVGALCLAGYYLITGVIDETRRTLNRHSLIEYCGADDIQRARRFSPLTRGVGITALAVMLTSATSGVEHEVSNGPLRPIRSVLSLFGSGDPGDYSLLLQSPNDTFMDDSVIPAVELQKVIAYGAQHNVAVIPFGKSLMNINGHSALELTLPDPVFATLTGVDHAHSCAFIPVIVDSTVGTDARGRVDINGVPVQPVSRRAGIAQMNRSIAFVALGDMQRCIENRADGGYFGAVVPGAAVAESAGLVAESGATGIAAVSEAGFEANNRDFWRANGTPILLQMMAYIAIFGAAASAGQVRNALQRNIREIGILHAGGVAMHDLRGVEDRRALWETLWAAAVAAPIIPVLAGAFNAAELGMQVGVGPRELAVGLSITLVAKLVASRRAVNRIGRNLNLPQAVKG